MLWLYILLGVLLLIFLILMIPVGVRVIFDGELRIIAKVGFIGIKVYPPKPKKEKKPKKKKEKKKKKDEKAAEEKPKEKTNLIKEKGIVWVIDTVKQLADLAMGVMKSFFKHLVIKNMQISIVYSGEDADDTAVHYGYFCMAVYPAVSILARAAKCRYYGVDIAPNFDEDAQSEYFADITLSVRIIWLVGLVLRHGLKAVRLILSIRKGMSPKTKETIAELEAAHKGENNMEHPIGNLMDITMQKIKEMVDVNTIIGEPIQSPDGTLIIPVSKVSYGFASGGSDLPTKKENKDCFGGGSGAGITIQPVAFLTVHQGEVRLINLKGGDGLDKIVGMVPEVFDKVKGFIKDRKNKKKDEAEVKADDFSEITVDDIDI